MSRAGSRTQSEHYVTLNNNGNISCIFWSDSNGNQMVYHFQGICTTWSGCSERGVVSPGSTYFHCPGTLLLSPATYVCSDLRVDAALAANLTQKALFSSSACIDWTASHHTKMHILKVHLWGKNTPKSSWRFMYHI